MNWILLAQFEGHCKAAGVEVPEIVVRAESLIAAARAAAGAGPGPLLGLAPEEVPGVVTDMAIRRHRSIDPGTGSDGILAGVSDFEGRVLAELQAAAQPELDDLLVSLRPRFDGLAAPLVDAAQTYGLTWNTSSDDVILMADEKASAAWRATRDAWHGLDTIVRLRRSISETFGLPPTEDDMDRVAMWDSGPTLNDPGQVDYSVCFAAGDNWSDSGGYYVKRNNVQASALRSHLDWLGMAAGGGLYLNTTTEVLAKLRKRAGVLIRESEEELLERSAAAKARAEATDAEEPDRTPPEGVVRAGGEYPIGEDAATPEDEHLAAPLPAATTGRRARK